MLEVLREAIDFAVPNQVSDKKIISVQLNSKVTRHHEFFIVDFDQGVVDKIIMVLRNLEGLVASRFGRDLEEKEMTLKRIHIENKYLNKNSSKGKKKRRKKLQENLQRRRNIP